jgi:hypothetical protein
MLLSESARGRRGLLGLQIRVIIVLYKDVNRQEILQVPQRNVYIKAAERRYQKRVTDRL